MHDTGVKLTEGSVGAPRTATSMTKARRHIIRHRMAATAEPCRNASAGSIGAALQPGADQVAELIDTHVAASTITFDPKYGRRCTAR